jgi:hypothetical protein
MYRDDLVGLLRSQHDNFDDAANVNAFDRDDDEDDDDNGLDSSSKLAVMHGRFRKHAEVSEDFEYCEEKFVDLGKFPSRFPTEEEALQAYNSIGLSHRI